MKKERIYILEPRYSERILVTGIAIFVVAAVVVLKGMLADGFK